jgi:threonine dehydratase
VFRWLGFRKRLGWPISALYLTPSASLPVHQMNEAVTVDDVMCAATRLKGKVQRTPLLESLALNNMTGARILVKAECLQVCLSFISASVFRLRLTHLCLNFRLNVVPQLQTAGSFKIRGALHRVLRLTTEQRERGVVAFSSGNFGQGLAAACGSFFDPPVRCTIVMPGNAPLSKQERARSYGATVTLSEIIPDVNREVTAAELAQSLAAEHGFTLLHPFEDPDVIAGQGSCAVELCEQAKEIGVSAAERGGLDALLIPAGGGGLSAGCSLATRDKFPNAAIFAVEPEGYG